MDLLFRRTKELERQIDYFLDLLVEGALLFESGLSLYFQGRKRVFEEKLDELDKKESEADTVRRQVEGTLYSQTLIPESRGDVLGLLESADKVLNQCADLLSEISIESPQLGDENASIFNDLAHASVASTESMVMAIRAYFREPLAVRDHITRSQFHEKESDRIAEAIKRRVFETDLELATKMHIGHFVNEIEGIADLAEDVCDRLAIATIKRSL